MSSCTCSKDAQITCIVHPTELSLKRRITELEAENAKLKQLAEPLTIALYKEMSKRHTEVCKENTKLREALETISRLEPYDGNRHVYHSAGKVARKALDKSHE